jgi:aerobic carbon-monoxide dehydrogenase large subunit
LAGDSTPQSINFVGAASWARGATGSVPALANAVLDALKAVNVQNLEMPYSAARIWEAIHRANRL